LLAIKTCSASGGKTLVLNEKHVALHHNIGWRKFQTGIRLLRKTRVILDRKQTGRRSYATETLATASDNFVLIDQGLLKEGSPLVAFVLAVNLSQDPMSPAEVGKRLGIKARATLRKLTKAAVKRGAIASATINGATWVGRVGGTNFDQVGVVKNGAAKNGVTKNGATHVRWKTPTLDGSDSQELPHGTRTPHATRGGAQRMPGVEEAKEREPETIVLADWKSSRRFREQEVHLYTGGNKIDPCNISLDHWLSYLARYGEAAEHLKTPVAYRQAVEIANEIAARSGNAVAVWQALPGIAFGIMQAVRKGREIRSLGFIADVLVRKVDEGDYTWAFDIPSTLAPDAHSAAFGHALRWVQDLEAAKFPLQRDAMLGTIEVEWLNCCLGRYGADAIAAAISAHLRETDRWPKEGRLACAWSWFDEAIEAAAAAAAKADACAARPEIKIAAELAEEAITALEKLQYGIKVDRIKLRSMPQIEELSVLIRRNTRNGVVGGINWVIDHQMKQQDGGVIVRWIWFEQYIKAATKAAKAGPALDPLLRSLADADGAQVLAPIFRTNRQAWARRLHAFLAEQRTRYGCADGDIMAVAVDLLRRLAVSDGAELRVKMLGESGHGSRVKRLNIFLAAVVSTMEREKAKQGRGGIDGHQAA
jgi:hypothetical protein